MQFKTTSNDTEFLGTFKFQCNQEPCKYEKSDFVSCLYDGLWWIGVIIEIDEAEMDCAIKFLHPPGPTTIFYWPARNDICRIPFCFLLSKVTFLKKRKRRNYILREDDYENIIKCFELKTV